MLVFSGGSKFSQRRCGDGGVPPPVREGSGRGCSSGSLGVRPSGSHRRKNGHRCRNNAPDFSVFLCSFGHGLSNFRDARVTRIGISGASFGLFVNEFCGKNRSGITWKNQARM